MFFLFGSAHRLGCAPGKRTSLWSRSIGVRVRFRPEAMV